MPNHIRTFWWLPPLTIAVLFVALAAGRAADAKHVREQEWSTSVDARSPGEPVLAIVSLQHQQITVYDAKGWILRAPVSSGQKGRETPAGIFSVLEKDADHHSNLYDDASMPHMQRLTWSGIALHGGPLPGHPASHGCVRLPYEFAERLFDMTRVGMRVIVAPRDVAPVAVAAPALFAEASAASAEAAAKAAAAEAEEAAKKADRARTAALLAARDAARAAVPVRVQENQKRKAEAALADAESAVAGASSDGEREAAADAKTKAAAALAEIEAQLAAATVEAQSKLDAVAPARQAVIAASADSLAAAENARSVARNLEPVSVFISRKTQRLYVRQAFEQIMDVPVTIRDPDRPIGTYVFTAMDRAGDNGAIAWTVVSLPHGPAERGAAEHAASAAAPGDRDVQLASTEPASPESALDRISIPAETSERIAAMIAPRSSLIISDEGISSETGRGTDFVVLLSGEPQGGIAIRHHNSGGFGRYKGDRYWSSPYRAPYSWTW
jgi:L,D-transpeptidase catalytic domain